MSVRVDDAPASPPAEPAAGTEAGERRPYLTRKQQEVLDLLRACHRRDRTAPPIRLLAAMSGRSPATMYSHLRHLERLGVVRKVHRSYVPVD